jgi:hypothetical protein
VGAGNGTINVAVQGEAVTDGFTAVYDVANRKWTLLTASGLSVSEAKPEPVPEGTTWTLTLPGRASVTITQKDIPFADGHTFRFSVFKSLATGGKQNAIDVGPLNASDGP